MTLHMQRTSPSPAPRDVASWTVTGSSTANAAQTLTRDAEAGRRHYITAFEVVLRAAAAGNDTRIEVRDGTTVLWDTYFGLAAARGQRVGVVFVHPIELSEGLAANLVIAAAGAGAITTANMAGYTI